MCASVLTLLRIRRSIIGYVKETAMPEVAVIYLAANGIGVLRLRPMGYRSIGSHVCNTMNQPN